MDRTKRNSKILVKTVGKVFCRETVLKNKMKRAIRRQASKRKEDGFMSSWRCITPFENRALAVLRHFPIFLVVYSFFPEMQKLFYDSKDISHLLHMCKYFPIMLGQFSVAFFFFLVNCKLLYTEILILRGSEPIYLPYTTAQTPAGGGEPLCSTKTSGALRTEFKQLWLHKSTEHLNRIKEHCNYGMKQQ